MIVLVLCPKFVPTGKSGAIRWGGTGAKSVPAGKFVSSKKE